MVRRNGAEVRKERLQDISCEIQSLLVDNKELLLSKIIAEIQYKYGLTKEKTIEYLKIISNVERFTLDIENNKIKKFIDV